MASNTENLMIGAGDDMSHQLGVEPDAQSSKGNQIVQMPAGIPLITKGLVSMSAGLRHSVFVFDDGKIIAAGDDRNDQIGVNQQQLYSVPTEVKILSESALSENGKVIQVACGEYYTAYLTENGSIFINGWRNPGNQYKAEIIEDGNAVKFVLIQAGFDAPVAIGENGALYIFDSYYNTKPPIKFISEKPFYDVARGSNFIIAIDIEGNVFGSGCAINNKTDITSKFEKIPNLGNIQSGRVFANYKTAAVLDLKEGKVYVMNTENKFELIESLQDQKVVNMDVGKFYALFVTDKSELFALGQNSFGELMLGKTDENPLTLTHGAFQRMKINFVKCGTHHSFAIVNGSPLQHYGAKKFNIK
ncbi:hypothetical protein M9Y10_022699 [Tritrichomonas musculus]|uniref:Uncharacterized protein n=1 Tax=Tritrichomonas musculus TaxID=1915356 RepID=A0ABR2KT02_9EUKA